MGGVENSPTAPRPAPRLALPPCHTTQSGEWAEEVTDSQRPSERALQPGGAAPTNTNTQAARNLLATHAPTLAFTQGGHRACRPLVLARGGGRRGRCHIGPPPVPPRPCQHHSIPLVSQHPAPHGPALAATWVQPALGMAPRPPPPSPRHALWAIPGRCAPFPVPNPRTWCHKLTAGDFAPGFGSRVVQARPGEGGGWGVGGAVARGGKVVR